ncbi:hypothetical protein OF829_11460 [Sphingomonas sp. LB-2]|uniref:hypothetical protein n=1 Tax=Sphingomonas caeni TaxID=2984949 RepID=UPI00222ED932|nr:hypothetical protein [Sphingomonas caeni]MCW3847858.1 hypothetical protein [Sphingomonas caeni]
MNVILDHDRLIAVNAARNALAGWGDRLTFGLGLPVLLLGAHAWLTSLPERPALYLSAAAGFVAAFGLARLGAGRLTYHQTEGALAAPALSRRAAAQYLLLLIGPALAMLAMIFLLAGLRYPACWLATMPAGIAAGFAWHRFSRPSRRFAPAEALARRRALLFDRPVPTAIAGIAAAAMLLALGSLLREAGMTALALATSLAASAVLGGADAAKVRFMAQAGYRATRTVALHASSLSAFTLAFCLPLLLARQFVPAATAAGLAALVLAVLAVRVLAYRIHARRTADWIATLLLAAVALAAILVPFAAPLVLLLILGWLFRRAGRVTWLIA